MGILVNTKDQDVIDLCQIFASDNTPVLATVYAVIDTYAEKQGRMMTLLHFMEDRLREEMAATGGISAGSLQTLISGLETVKENAVALEYTETANHVQRRIEELRKGWHKPGDLPGDLRNIRDRFSDDAKKLLLFKVPSNGADYHEKPTPFGVELAAKFPDAQRDLTEAGTCYSLGRSTACVLHLMRALESALHRLAGLTIAIGPKDTMGMIANKLKTYSTGLSSTTVSQSAYKHKVSNAAMHFQDITNAMRNPAMHTGEFFSMEQAHAAIVSTRLFLLDLADLV